MQISGNISLDQMLSPQLNPNSLSNRKLYSYFLTGGLNTSIYGITMPLSFSYTNQNLGFTHPFTFNQFGAQPSYKWVKAFVGYNSFSYSPYTLNGHQFCGFGIEVAPPNTPVAISAVFGRLLKAVEMDTSQSIPSYQRMGIGLKTSVNLKKVNLSTSIFYSWDQENSISILPDSLGLPPKENITFSVEGSVQPISGLKLDLNVGNSVMTDDKFSAISNEKKFWGGLIPTHTSTSSHWAYKSALNYSIKNGTLGVGFERIQPNFQTLGAYYFTNDLENITIIASQRIMDGKINFNTNIGVQRDNLNDQKLFSNQRVVGAANLSLLLSDKLNINASFSSFNAYTNIRSVFDIVNSSSPYQNLDTLNFSQINKSGMLSAAYGFGVNDAKQSLSISFSGNQSQNKQSTLGTTDDAIFINSGLTYSLSFAESGWNFSLSTLYNTNSTSIGKTNTLGPFVNITKSIKKYNIRAGLSSAFNQSYQGNDLQSSNFNVRINGSWSAKEGHTVSLSSGYFNFLPISNDMVSRKELTFNITYSYQFSHKFNIKKKAENKAEIVEK